MRLVNFILVLVLFSLPLALATNVVTDKINYASGETVKISGTCDGASKSVALQVAITGNTLWFKQTNAGSDKAFSIDFTPPQTGKFTLLAACNGETAKSTPFDVGITTTTDTTSSSSSSSSSSSGGGGGGGGSCSAVFECSAWSYCNSSLKQTQTCSDTKNCKPNYITARNCTKCDESWVCSKWSSCDGTQTRTCADEHKCGTYALKPELERSCDVTYTAPPAQTYTPPSTKQAPVEKPKVTPTVTLGFWDKYLYYVIGGGAFILLAAGVAVFLVLRRKSSSGAENIDELKGWISQEKAAGITADKIREMLAGQGWENKDISKALG